MTDAEAAVRSREAFGIALGIVEPTAVSLRNGSVRLTGRRDVLPADVVSDLDERLTRRALDKASDERLLVEAVTILGAEIARSRGEEPAAGATAALDRLLRVPGLAQERREEAGSMLRSVLQSAAPTSPAAAERLAGLAPGLQTATTSEIVAAAHEISHDSQQLAPATTAATATAAAVTPVAGSGVRPQVGRRHRPASRRERTTVTREVRGTGLVTGVGGRPATEPDLSEDTALAALRRLGRVELGAAITSPPSELQRPKLAVVAMTTSEQAQHIRVEILPVGHGRVAEGKLRSGTEHDPHVLRISPRLGDEQLAQVWVNQLSQFNQKLEATKAERPTGVLGRLRSFFRHETRDLRLTADYANYQQLSNKWHTAQAEFAATGAVSGPQSITELERDVAGLAQAIVARGGTRPALPWAAESIHAQGAAAAGLAAAAAEQAATAAEPEPNSPAQLREQVVAEITKLEGALIDLEAKATAKDASSEVATAAAEKNLTDAAAERKFKDRFAPERARKLEVEAATASAKAGRHQEIAGAYREAAADAGKAITGYQALLDEIDAAVADPSRPRTGITDLAREAAEKVEKYEKSVDLALPVKDLLHTGVPTGQAVVVPIEKINEVLTANGIDSQFGADGPQLMEAAEYRRLLSSEGMIIEVPGPPDDDVTEVAQARLKAKRKNVREVLDPGFELAEQMAGTIGDGGQGVTTSATHTVGFNAGLDAQPLLALAPGTGVGELAQVVSPRVDYSSSTALTSTAGASTHTQVGAVDDNRGESLLVEWDGEWEIEVRKSPTEPWSPVVTTDAGRQLTWVSSAYTVKPPAETVTLEQLGRGDEVTDEFPRHTVTEIAGLNAIADKVIAQGREELGPIDRVAHNHIRGLITEDGTRLLRELAKPGGYGRRIITSGESQYHLQLEAVPVWSTAKPLGESSREIWQEEVLVPFDGVSASQTFSSSVSASAALAFPGKPAAGALPGYLPSPTALSDLGDSTADLSPSASIGRNVSRQGGMNVSSTSIVPAVNRYTGPTQGVIVDFEIKATLRKLDDPQQKTVVAGDTCKATLRVPENDLLRCGGAADKFAVLRDEAGDIRLDRDGRALLRGDAEPATGDQTLPPWNGPEAHQLRGVGQALVQDLTGADEARADTLRALSAQGLVPPLDDKLQPQFDALPSDPRRRAGQLENYDRVHQTVNAERLQAAYNTAAQSGLRMVLIDHRTGHAPKERHFRVAIEQDLKDIKPGGTSTDDIVVHVPIKSDATGRSAGRSKGVPMSVGAKLSNGPAKGIAGLAFRLGARLNRTALGRNFGWTIGGRAQLVSLTESTGPVDKPKPGHRIKVTEITAEGDSAPLADVPGRSTAVIDNALTTADPIVLPANAKVPEEVAIRRATPVAVDAGDPVDRIHTAVDAIQPGSTGYLELSTMLSSESMLTHPDWRNGEYRLPLVVTPAPSTPRQALEQGTLQPQELSVVVRGQAKSMTFVAMTDQNTADINFTMNDAGFTSGRSGSGGVALEGGGGAVGADGTGPSAGASLGRTGGWSQSTTNSQTTGEERLLVNTGTQYQFLEQFSLQAEIKKGDEVVRTVPLEDASSVSTMPERRALRLYGTGELDLPLSVVSDAAERYLEGQLKLTQRDAAAFVWRYKEEKAGVTTGLAATHTEERLTAKVLETSGGSESTATTASDRLDAALVGLKQLGELERDAELPERYKTGLASAQIEDLSPVGEPGKNLDLVGPILPTVEELAPGLLARNPLVRPGLDVNLGPTGVRGHLNDMLGPRGYVTELDVPVDGHTHPDLVMARAKAGFANLKTAAGPVEIGVVDAIGLIQKYGYVQANNSVSHSTTYSGGVEAAGPGVAGTNLTGGLSTDRTRVVQGEAGTTNTDIDRSGKLDKVEVKGQVVFDVELTRVHNAGAAAMASARWKLSRNLPAANTTVAPPVQVRADITMYVPRAVLERASEAAQATLAAGSERPLEHRGFALPEGATVEGMLPYGEGETREDQLYNRLYGRLEEILGPGGAREYQASVETQLGPTALENALRRLTSQGGLRMLAMADRGNGNTTISPVITARTKGIELHEGPIPGQRGRVGRKGRSIRASTTGNTLLPVTATGGVSGGIVNVGGSVGDQLKKQSSDSHGTRLETTTIEEGDQVVVKIPVAYDITLNHAKDTGRGEPKVTESEFLPEAANAVYFVEMLEHEYLDILRQQEASLGQSAPDLQAAPPQLGKPDLRATEYGQDASGKTVHQPYRPLLEALAKARSERNPVVLAVQEADGHERLYQALPNGTMTGVNDGGFAAAFASLHPQLALMAEGRVDLRELFNNLPPGQGFSGSVAIALERNGVPASILKGLDHATTVRQLDLAAGNGGPPSAAPVGRFTQASHTTGHGHASHGPSLSGP